MNEASLKKKKVLAIQRCSIFQLDYINDKLCLFVVGLIVSATLVPLRGCTSGA